MDRPRGYGLGDLAPLGEWARSLGLSRERALELAVAARAVVILPVAGRRTQRRILVGRVVAYLEDMAGTSARRAPVVLPPRTRLG